MHAGGYRHETVCQGSMEETSIPRVVGRHYYNYSIADLADKSFSSLRRSQATGTDLSFVFFADENI